MKYDVEFLYENIKFNIDHFPKQYKSEDLNGLIKTINIIKEIINKEEIDVFGSLSDSEIEKDDLNPLYYVIHKNSLIINHDNQNYIITYDNDIPQENVVIDNSKKIEEYKHRINQSLAIIAKTKLTDLRVIYKYPSLSFLNKYIIVNDKLIIDEDHFNKYCINLHIQKEVVDEKI